MLFALFCAVCFSASMMMATAALPTTTTPPTMTGAMVSGSESKLRWDVTFGRLLWSRRFWWPSASRRVAAPAGALCRCPCLSPEALARRRPAPPMPSWRSERSPSRQPGQSRCRCPSCRPRPLEPDGMRSRLHHDRIGQWRRPGLVTVDRDLGSRRSCDIDAPKLRGRLRQSVGGVPPAACRWRPFPPSRIA